LYQKAIAKCETEYGKNSWVLGSLYYQLGVRALALSKFDLAEHCFKKAVEINPNSEAAQIMLVQLLRFRSKDEAAYMQTEQALKKHEDSTPLRRNLVLLLQERNPAGATQQAYIIDCLQNGNTDKLSAHRQADKALDKDADNKQTAAKASSKPTARAAAKAVTQVASPGTAGQLIYQPLSQVLSKKHITVSRPRSHRVGKMPAGLVPPPPPPAALGFPVLTQTGSASRGPTPMKAKAKSLKIGKDMQAQTQAQKERAGQKATAKAIGATGETQKPAAERAFLIDWASVKKKH
jgi:tetratricopeptide (TPR) repeat protein